MSQPNIDLMDAQSMLEEAYELLSSFEQTIINSLESDHPDLVQVQLWLHAYETADE